MSEWVVRAFLTADKVIKEDNGKHAVIGIFDRFTIDKFPATPPPWFVYVSISNLAPGEHSFAFNFVHNGTSSTVFSAGGNINIKAPESGIEMVLPVQATLPTEGPYTASFHVDGDVVMSKEITTGVKN